MTCHQTVLSNLQAHANLFELHAAAHEIPTPGILAQSGSAVLCHDERYRVCDGNMAKSLEYELLLENLIYIMYVYIYIMYIYINIHYVYIYIMYIYIHIMYVYI